LLGFGGKLLCVVFANAVDACVSGCSPGCFVKRFRDRNKFDVYTTSVNYALANNRYSLCCLCGVHA
jgi:hypothetical protein